ADELVVVARAVGRWDGADVIAWVREVVGHRLHRTGRVDLAHPDIARHAQDDGRVVEDGGHAASHPRVCGVLRRGGRHGHDAHSDALVTHHAGDVGVGHDAHAAGRHGADVVRLAVKDGGDVE